MWLASNDLENSLEVTSEADKVVLPKGQDHAIWPFANLRDLYQISLPINEHSRALIFSVLLMNNNDNNEMIWITTIANQGLILSQTYTKQFIFFLLEILTVSLC